MHYQSLLLIILHLGRTLQLTTLGLAPEVVLPTTAFLSVPVSPVSPIPLLYLLAQQTVDSAALADPVANPEQKGLVFLGLISGKVVPPHVSLQLLQLAHLFLDLQKSLVLEDIVAAELALARTRGGPVASQFD